MALNLGDLFYNITADYKSVSVAIDKVEKLEKKLDKRPKPLNVAVNDNEIIDAGKSIDNLGDKIGRLEDKVDADVGKISSSFFNMKTAVIGSSLAVGALVYSIGKFAVEAGRPIEQAEARLKNMLGSVEAVNASMATLRQQAYTTGGNIVTLADNFAKMTVFVNSGQISLKDAIDLSIGLDNALTALGGSSDNLGNIMYGLSQAMGSGIVRAEEFNQVMEPLPGLLNRVEQSNGMASGSLRQMINDGQVTSEMFKNLLIPALKSFQEEAIGMSDTLTAQQGKMSATFQALGEDIYDLINKPLASAIALMNEFLQTFVSTKRASGDELQRRLNDIVAEQSALAPSLGGQGKGAKSRQARFATLEAQANEIIAEMQNRNADNLSNINLPNNLAKSATATAIGKPTGGGGASKVDNKKSELNELLNLQKEYAQLEIDLIQDKFSREQAIAEQRYSERQMMIEQFAQKGIITRQQQNELEAQNELDVTNRLLEIQRQREEQKLRLEQEFNQFKAESQATELERQLATENLNYQARLEKLREFLEQKLLTEQEYKQLEQAESENFKKKEQELRENDKAKNEKEIEEKYKKNYLAKVAYGAKETKLAEFLSSKEVDTAIGGMEQTLQAASATSKQAFEMSKALSISKAIVAGVESAIHAYNFGNEIGGPVVGGIFAGMSVAFTGAQISALSSQQFQGGRMAGGHVSANSTYRVGENNRPEMLSVGNENFLMMGNRGGMVTPNNALGGNGGGVIITIVNQVSGVEFQENRIDDNHIEIIAMRIVNNEAPNVVGREFANPNSRISRSMQSNFKVDRRR